LSGLKERVVSPDTLVWVILGAIVAFSAAAVPRFPSPRNLYNVFLTQPIGIGIASLGQAFVVIAGGIDLSVGSVISLLTSLIAGVYKANPDIPVYQMVLLIIGMGVAIGAINGSLVVYLRVTPFMATLATMSIHQGLALFYLKKTIGGIPKTFRFIADGRVGTVPFGILLFAGILALSFVLLRKNKLGRHMHAVGSDAYVAMISGIAVNRVKLAAYAAGGFLVAVTSIYLAARMGGGGPKLGVGYELDTITAIVIGGVSLGGGTGNVICVFGGVLIISIFANIMNLLNMNPFFQIVLKGAVLIMAVSFYSKKRAAGE
jgi:ribose/xylose/arabinose/galactoside ABC-type transport system permease subunit